MRRAVWGAIFLLAGVLLGESRPLHHHVEDEDNASTMKVGGLSFLVPDRWTSEPPDGSARSAQWRIPPPRGQAMEGLEVVVFFFGPSVGGNAQENIDAWVGTMTAPDGSKVTPNVQKSEIAGHKVTQILLLGNYSQPNSQPGIPPTIKSAYGLLGAVVENPAGNIYWRVTGPATEVAADAPLLTKVIASLKPQDKP